MPIAAGSIPGQVQQPGIQSVSPVGVAHTQVPKPFSATSQGM